MLKIVTLDEEEIEILLSHHKQKLADVTAEIQALTEQQQFSETRLRELTDVHEKEDEASIEEHLSDVVDIQDDGTLTVAAAHESEAEARHDETPEVEAEHETEEVHEHAEVEAAHEPEEVHEHADETPAVEASNELEEVHEHADETPEVEAAHETEEAHKHADETSTAVISHEPESVVPHKGTFTIASE